MDAELVGVSGAGDTLMQSAAGTMFHVLAGEVSISGMTVTGGIGSPLDTATSPLVGGGVRVDGSSSLTLTECVIQSNSADIGGGAFVAEGGQLTLINTEVRDNSAENGSGGGIAGRGAALTLESTVIEQNSAVSGGGVDLQGGMLSAVDSSLSNNQASEGGGLYASGAVIDGLLFMGNEALRGGGLSLYEVEASRLRVEDNEATEQGGGVSIRGSTVVLREVDIVANTAPNGGGLYSSGDVAMVDGSIVSNSATHDAGGGASAVGTLCSNGTDWGAEAEDNVPRDLFYHSSSRTGLEDDEVFVCSGGSWPCEEGELPSWCQ